MRNFENALISRRSYPIDDGRMVIEEKWDVTHKDCPFVTMDAPRDFSYLLRHAVMSKTQYAELLPPNKG